MTHPRKHSKVDESGMELKEITGREKKQKEIQINCQPEYIRNFDQSDLIKGPPIIRFGIKELYAKWKRGRLFSPVIDLEGLCNGLVNLWCEYKKTDRDLIAELTAPKLKPELITRIEKTQLAGGVVIKKTQDDKSELNNENLDDNFKLTKIKKKLKVKDGEHIRESAIVNLGNLECSAAVITPGLSLQTFEEKLSSLSEKQTKYGMHIISLGFKNIGHALAWTYSEEYQHYVLFDPNVGELYFDTFEKFKLYLCYCYLPDIFRELNIDIKELEIQSGDYYFPEDKLTFLPR